MTKTLFIVFGLPGSGKSTAAGMIVDLLGQDHCTRITPDVIRKELFPIPQYDKSASKRVWEESLARAKGGMSAGKIVVWDALFAHEHRRQEVQMVAKKYDYTCVFLHVSCPDESVIKQRLATRVNDASDADFEVYKQLKEVFQHPKNPSEGREIDNSGDQEALLKIIQELLPSLSYSAS